MMVAKWCRGECRDIIAIVEKVVQTRAAVARKRKQAGYLLLPSYLQGTRKSIFGMHERKIECHPSFLSPFTPLCLSVSVYLSPRLVMAALLGRFQSLAHGLVIRP